jgi:hypothetical protein
LASSSPASSAGPGILMITNGSYWSKKRLSMCFGWYWLLFVWLDIVLWLVRWFGSWCYWLCELVM